MSYKAFLKSRPRSTLGMDDEQDAGFLEGCLGLQPSQANAQKYSTWRVRSGKREVWGNVGSQDRGV